MSIYATSVPRLDAGSFLGLIFDFEPGQAPSTILFKQPWREIQNLI
jgi:hypothetical protein